MRRVVTASGELAELRNMEEFPDRATEVLRRLIPCEHCGYNAIDLDTGRAVVVANPRDVVFDGGPEALARLGHQNPLIRRALAGERSVQRLSDHITRRQLHRTQLYQDVYQHSSLEYQLGVQLPKVGRFHGRAGTVAALSLARRHRDFTPTDALVLDLLRPHFAATLERLHQLALAQALLAGLHAGGDRWVVLVDSEDIVAFASDGAADALGIRLGERPQLGPALRVTRVLNAYPELDALHIAPAPLPDPRALHRLGLTKRQSEVLALAARGFSAQQIADTLVLSRRTVEKHFEAIYTTLRVRTRAQAVAVAVSGAHGPTGTKPRLQQAETPRRTVASPSARNAAVGESGPSRSKPLAP